MPRPLSGNQLTKLGKRLAQPGPISDEDYDLLQQVADYYGEVTIRVQARLQALGLEPTAREFKSTGTLVDKLRRTPSLSLKDIHDLGGARIVIDGDLVDQDRLIERIIQAFQDCPKPPLKIDRRESPSHGYRAVHVIVYEASTPMEIQVRTKLQDTWAQISEKLGDVWGRGLRYGEGPDLPDSPAQLASTLTRREVVGQLQELAGAIERTEMNEVLLSQLREEMLEPGLAIPQQFMQRLGTLTQEVADSKAALQGVLDRLLRGIRHLGGAQ
jgi:ppGpp synthetase/RelA/SpoT-type nucleotidyltranferase